LVIFANIGDIALQASRESVGYNAQTILFVKNRLKKIEDEIRAEADKKQAMLTSEYEARKLYFDLFNTAGQFGVLAELFKTYIEVCWGNVKITTPNFPNTLFGGFYAKKYYDRMGKLRIKVEDDNGYHGWPIIQMENESPCRLFYDLKECGKGKIRNTARHYIEVNRIEEDEQIYVIQPNSIEELRQICLDKGIKFDSFQDFASITPPPKPRAARALRDKLPVTNCRAYDPTGELEEDNDDKDMARIDVDFKTHEGGYYMLREYSNYFFGMDGNTLKTTTYNINSLFDYLTKLDPEFNDHPVIYTFGIKKAGKLGPQWKRIDQALIIFLTSHYANLTKPKLHYHNLEDYAFANMLNEVADKLKMDEVTDIVSRINFDLDRNDDPYKYIAQALGVATRDVGSVKQDEINSLNKEITEIKKMFPMVKFFNHYTLSDGDFQKEFVKYARLILEKEKSEKNLDQIPEMV